VKLRKFTAVAALVALAAPGAGQEYGPAFGTDLGLRLQPPSDEFRVVEAALPEPVPPDGYVERRTVGAMLDFYPDGDGFRLSAGIRVAPDRVRRSAALWAVPPVRRLRSSYRTRDWAPAVTAGYARAWASGLTAAAEAGAEFHGAPRIGWEAGDRMAIRNDFDDYKLRPVVRLSLGYRF